MAFRGPRTVPGQGFRVRGEGFRVFLLVFSCLDFADFHQSQGIFLVSTAEVFTLYKRMCPLWECFGSSWGELGEWVGSDVLGSSWGVGWEH